MRRTKIVCTLGPATETLEVMVGLLQAGMDVARLNMSHGTHEDHRRRLQLLHQAEQQVGTRVAVMLDTRGPEIRIGTFREGKVTLHAGDRFVITARPVVGDATQVSVEYPGLPQDVRAGNVLLLDDGNLVLRVVGVEGPDIQCVVEAGGVLSDRKKINVPGVAVSLPSFSDKDMEDLAFGVEQEVDFVAASFVRQPEDVVAIRRVLEERGSSAAIIAKIENREGVDNLPAILKVADGLMVARGDLGVEIPAEEVPLLQKRMIRLANEAGKPVITATQMLESMVQHPRPTRAEASDVANAILDGTDAVMLSAETASGAYPVESVRVMARIAERVEEALPYETLLHRRDPRRPATVTDAVSHATCTTASDLGAAAIVCATHSGHTARMVSKYRPRCPIVAVTPSPVVARQLRLVWGTVPVITEAKQDTDGLLHVATQAVKDAGLIRDGDLVVITAGVPVGVPGTTNLIKVHTVGDVLARGTGIGQKSAAGRVAVVRRLADLDRVREGDILVARSTSREMVPAMERAAGVVTEEGGLTSHAAVVGLTLGIPVIVGCEAATSLLPEGETVTVDGSRGLIYRGRARV